MTSSPTSAVSPITTPVAWSMNNPVPKMLRMDVDAGQNAGDLPERARGHLRAAFPQPVADPVTPDGVHTRIGEDDLQRARDGGVALLGRSMSPRKAASIASLRPRRAAYSDSAREGREHDDNQLSGVLGTPGDLQGSHVAAPEEMRPATPLAGQPPSQTDRVVVADRDDLVDEIHVKHLWMKPAPMPWIGGVPSCAGQYRRGGRFHRDELDRGLRSLRTCATPVMVPRCDSGDEDVDLAVGVAPHFFSGGSAVNRRVGRVFELLGMK